MSDLQPVLIEYDGQGREIHITRGDSAQERATHLAEGAIREIHVLGKHGLQADPRYHKACLALYRCWRCLTAEDQERLQELSLSLWSQWLQGRSTPTARLIASRRDLYTEDLLYRVAALDHKGLSASPERAVLWQEFQAAYSRLQPHEQDHLSQLSRRLRPRQALTSSFCRYDEQGRLIEYRPDPRTPVQKCEAILWELHALEKRGKGDCQLADALHAELRRLWPGLLGEDQDRLNQLWSELAMPVTAIMTNSPQGVEVGSSSLSADEVAAFLGAPLKLEPAVQVTPSPEDAPKLRRYSQHRPDHVGRADADPQRVVDHDSTPEVQNVTLMTFWRIGADGQVQLPEGLSLDVLRRLREAVNTAIYDRERGQ